MARRKFRANMFHRGQDDNDIRLEVALFDTLIEAIEHAKGTTCFSFKIYDFNGCICHTSDDCGHDCYA
jgi:hypothetical protein